MRFYYLALHSTDKRHECCDEPLNHKKNGSNFNQPEKISIEATLIRNFTRKHRVSIQKYWNENCPSQGFQKLAKEND